ncbi:ubinuclein-2-like [Physella acuta]|uniref:ubinuclein-2-like n=1 Tax=Physella acuta TaxID=109671 RepID=UPI0027DB1A64|nr:ubinuclein-2-like [Physella acuta]
MKSYNLCKSRNQTAEDFIRAYLDTDIKPIWPQGWMQTRMLFKESRAAHEDMTKVLNKEPKQKKNVSLVKASSPTPEQSNQDTVRAHVSKTEDVIEITDEKTDTVVVNLPNVDVKPLSTVSTYNSSPKISQPSNADTSAGSRINKQANTPWTALATPTSTSMSQKPNDNLNNSSSKWSQKAESAVPSVTPTSPSVQKTPVISRSSHQGLSPPVSSSTPGGADNSPTSANSTRTFMTAFESFAGAYSRSDTTASISSPQTPKQSILGQQPAKAVPLQPALTFEQQQLASPQQKSSQEQKVVNAQQQKAAARSSSSVVVNKDIPNASWSNVNSVVPQGKTSSPAGLIGRVPVISPSTVGGSSDKSRQLLVHQEKQTKFINTVCAKLDQSTSSNKKRAQVSNMGSSYQTSPQQKQSSMSYPYPMSSKQDMQQRSTVPSSNGPSPAHKWSGSTSQQIQSCTVIGTSSSIHGPNMPFMRALGPGTPNVQPNAKSKQTYGTIRQPSPPQKAQSTLPRPSAHNETGLLNSPMVSVSRGSTPSPQRSPISPEQPSLSLYEQIQSQIRNQEAMEGQALKNLAMALSYTNSSNPGFQGVKPAQIRGMHSEVSDSQSTSAVVTSKSIIPSPIQALPVQSCEKLDRPVQPKQHSVILGRDCDSFGVQYSAREWGGKSPGDKSLSKKEFEVTETVGVYTETTAADSKHVTGGNEFSTYMIQSKKMEPQQRSDVTAEYYRESLIFKKPFQTFKSPGSYAPQTRATAPIKINCVDKPSGKAIYKQNVSQGQSVHRTAANMVLDSKCNDIMAKFTADPKVTTATRDHQHIASPAGDCLFPVDQMLNHSLPQYPYSLKYAEHSTDKSLETQTFPGQVSVQNMLNSAPPSVSLGKKNMDATKQLGK